MSVAEQSLTTRDHLRAGAREGMPVAVAAAVLGMSFGITAEPIIGAVASISMSVLIFAGSAQFAATAVLAVGGSPAAAVVAGILLNLRFLPMGVAIAPSTRGNVLERAAVGQAINDAAWAIANLGGGRFEPRRMIGSSLAQYPAWVAGTVAGVLGAGLLDDPKSLGLDAIFPAFFLVLLLSETRSRDARVVAVLGALIALALIPHTPPGIPILAASGAAMLAWRPR